MRCPITFPYRHHKIIRNINWENRMKSHIVINGNAFYEVDEECLKRQKQEKESREVKTQHTDGSTSGKKRENVSKADLDY
jgi:hypothetical protein